jgi:penicillin-binding protein 2
MLYNDSIAKPLYDRGLLAEYPPGSPFKILTGLIGLQERRDRREHHSFLPPRI